MKPGVLLRLGWFALAAWSLQAKDLTAYHVGDVAETDLTTPVALDVVDAAATAALKSARAQQFPAIFRHYPEATNVLRRDFLAAFAQARTNFIADVTIEFHSPTLDQATVASGDFERLVTVFDVENRAFPITDDLAAQWARGADGEAIRDKLLATLEWAASRPVRPDALPDGMVIGEMARLVPVAEVNQSLSFETVQAGALAPAASVTTLSDTQALFRREFPQGQQIFARALAAFLKPNCFPDAPFTKLTRGAAMYQMVVADHFDAGDVIVHQGETINEKSKAILAAASEKLAHVPPAPAVTVAPTPPPPVPKRSAPAVAAPATPPSLPWTQPASTPAVIHRVPHWGLILTLAGISLGALVVAAWQALRNEKRPATTALATQPPLPMDVAKPADLNPQVAQAVREAVQQELAMQRRELLLAQQAAADDIAALVQRLDDLQLPMQQRLHTYENRIQSLEAELALRNEENRQLLKLKIEMVSRQLETERAATLNTSISA